MCRWEKFMIFHFWQMLRVSCAAVVSANLVVENHAKLQSRCPFYVQPLWTAIYEDEDEKFDASLFKVPLNYSGSFLLPNQVFTEDLINMSSSKSQAIATHLQEKVSFL